MSIAWGSFFLGVGTAVILIAAFLAFGLCADRDYYEDD
jgi:hypothetical protein